MSHMKAVINTLQASGTTLWLANNFGRKTVVNDELGEVTLTRWFGKDYLFDYKPGAMM